LGGGPYFWILRNRETVYIRWDNRDATIGDIDIWDASVGEYRLSVNEFLSEIHCFHNTLMQAMHKRISAIVADNPFPHVTIDIDGLVAEHEERGNSLEKAISREATINNWSSVIDAGTKLFAKKA